MKEIFKCKQRQLTFPFECEIPFSQVLHMSIEFMEDAVIWDAAHHLQLVHDDVKKTMVKKYHSGNDLIQPTPWLPNLDKSHQSIMTKLESAQSHSNLYYTFSNKMGEQFLQLSFI